MQQDLDPVIILPAHRFEDDRGWFQETYSSLTAVAAGVGATFVQDNHSMSRATHTLRGLHFQLPPYAQDKLVRCVKGRVLDVAVDLRRNSPSYGRWVGVELAANTGLQLFVPVGFAHGFLTLEQDSEVIYKVSAPYSPTHESGICWNDPSIGVDWGLAYGEVPVLSPKDTCLPDLTSFQSPFPYDGRPLTSFGVIN